MTDTTTTRAPIDAEAAEVLATHLLAELPAHGHEWSCWTLRASRTPPEPCFVRCSAIRAALKAAGRLTNG